jgi:hypothetical protein
MTRATETAYYNDDIALASYSAAACSWIAAGDWTEMDDGWAGGTRPGGLGLYRHRHHSTAALRRQERGPIKERISMEE